MSKETKYGISSLKKDFPTDNACLEYLFDTLYDRTCSCGGTYSLMATRKQFQCSKCRKQIAPTVNTIFHKSSTPLTLWFHAIHVFSNAKSGISAKEMERQLEVTYKTAYRILKLIRESLGQDTKKLKGIVETDSAYFGGRSKQKFTSKSLVMGAVERGGTIKVKIVKDNSTYTHKNFLEETIVKEETKLMTDSSVAYNKVFDSYDRHFVNHSKKEYVRNDIYTNTIEGFWSHVKRSIKGTHKVISKQHLQSYLNGFVFHYNHRVNDRKRFSALVDTLLRV